ncbi:HAD-IB family hydrolase, partial [Nocardia nova]|uniref:HAD family hydrolase n=1 Tax=Nocardia nova TaxID=37330 RepID=UPI0025B081BD
MNLSEAISAIRTGPQGPRVAAVFDFGGTVVAGFAPAAAPLRLLRGRDSRRALTDTLLYSIRGSRTEGEYERFLQRLARVWAGRTEEELTELGEQLFRSTVYGHVYPEAWQLVREHEAAGHTVVMVTSLTRFQVLPAARELGVNHVLYTAMATADGVLTGFTEGKPLWRNEKAAAVRRFAAEHDIDPADSYAYADAAPDIPLLETVGHPVAVNPGPRMSMTAGERDWPTLTFKPREPARVTDFARTAVGFTGLLSGAAFGVASRAATRRHRAMADAMIATAADTTLRTTGVRGRVV